MIRRKKISFFSTIATTIRQSLSSRYMVDMPQGKNVLVISPHPDDEILGCGGTIRLHFLLDHVVSIIYLTDGEKGIQTIAPSKAADIRIKEAIRAASQIGVTKDRLHFLHLEDGKVINSTEVHDEFKKLLEALRPDVIYLPSFLEDHKDHYAANIILESNLDFPVSIAAYEVWTPLVPNLLVNITEVMQAKLDAIKEYESQLNELDYGDAILGLNRYRAAMFGKKSKYAEAFIYCSSSKYFQLLNSEKLSA